MNQIDINFCEHCLSHIKETLGNEALSIYFTVCETYAILEGDYLIIDPSSYKHSSKDKMDAFVNLEKAGFLVTTEDSCTDMLKVKPQGFSISIEGEYKVCLRSHLN